MTTELDPSASAYLMAKEAFIARQQEEARAQKWLGFYALAVLLVVVVGTAATMDWVRAHPVTSRDPILSAYALFMVFGAAGIAVPVVVSGRASRRRQLRCPACAWPLPHTAAKRIIASGLCPRCGAGVFNSSPAENPPPAAAPCPGG